MIPGAGYGSQKTEMATNPGAGGALTCHERLALMSHGPGMSVAILRKGEYFIASIQSDLSDTEVLALRDDLIERVGRFRALGIVVDVSALDVIDSFVARALRSIALAAKLRGAHTVIVGIRPDVAV